VGEKKNSFGKGEKNKIKVSDPATRQRTGDPRVKKKFSGGKSQMFRKHNSIPKIEEYKRKRGKAPILTRKFDFFLGRRTAIDEGERGKKSPRKRKKSDLDPEKELKKRDG